jgi:hypothetical protein
VKHSTAVRHLAGLAEEASRLAEVPNFDWPLQEMWAAGEVLDGSAPLDTVKVMLMLDVPVEELSWLALHPVAEWVAEMMRLPKLPVARHPRPAAGPAWNPLYVRVVRFWDSAAGLDGNVIEALRAGERVPGFEPEPGEYVRQMEAELELCRAHLDAVLDEYWERDWRREHRGYGIYPEDHLWRAAEAVRDVKAALDRTAG